MSLVYDKRAAARRKGALLSLGAAAVIGRFLEHVFGQIRVVDFSFPHSGFSGVVGDVLVGIARPEQYTPAAKELFSRFRQAGGQLPILSLGPGSLDPVFRESRGSSDKVTVLYLENDVDADVVSTIAGVGSVAVLVGMDAAAGAWPDGVLDDRRSVDLLIAGVRDRVFRLVLPEGEFAGLNAFLSGDSTLEGARISRRIVKKRLRELRASVELDAVAGTPAVLSFTAARFIHDGGYRCEIDSGYSWLWSGPSPHLRLLVGGQAPVSDRLRLKLTVVNTNDPGNLEGIRIMIDGCVAPFTLEKWSATSGRVVVDVPQPSADFTVLSVGCRNMSSIDVSRQVGLCVDRLEVHP
ncbi:hypothetical protein ACUSIJ_24030 [Pseudochelatococcus sp. B33]